MKVTIDQGGDPIAQQTVNWDPNFLEGDAGTLGAAVATFTLAITRQPNREVFPGLFVTITMSGGMPECRNVESPIVATIGLVSVPALAMPTALPMLDPIATVVSIDLSGSIAARV